MLSDVMEHYGLNRDFSHAGYFETEHHRQLVKELKSAIKQGQMIAFCGIVGCGKSTTVKAVKQELAKEKEILVSNSLSVEKAKVNLGTLMTALFYDLITEKDFKVPTQPERRERALQALIKKRVLCIFVHFYPLVSNVIPQNRYKLRFLNVQLNEKTDFRMS